MKSTSVLKGIRSKRILSQEKVAQMMEMTRQSYNSLENDLLHSDFTLIFKLLDNLNVTTAEMDEFFDALKQDYLSYKENK